MTTQISGTTGVSKVQDGVVVQADLEPGVVPLGVGQTWQDVSVSRASGVTYTNTTGRPIQVNISNGGTGIPVQSTLTIAGVVVAISFAPTVSGQTTRAFVTGVVPAGATYSAVIVGNSLFNWAELR